MSLPKYDEIHLPLLKLFLNRSKHIHSFKEAVEILAKEFGLTDDELNKRVPSGGRKFYYQVSFSKMLLVRAGLVFDKKIPFRATDKARKVIAQNPNKITKRCLDDLAKDRQKDKIIKEKILKQKLILKRNNDYLEKLKQLDDPDYFERISGLVLAKVYNKDFLSNIEITPSSNDGGIDGIIHLGKDENSKIYFECKLKSNYPVGEPLLRNFVGALEGVNGTKGYFITTSRFTSEAVKYVNKLRYKDIVLINGHTLVELIFKYSLENEIIPIQR